MEGKEKEKVKACLAQVRRDHQFWSSGDEDEEPTNKIKRGNICMVATSEEDLLNQPEEKLWIHGKGRDPQHR